MGKDDVLVAVGLRFEPRDLWLGCYWKTGWSLPYRTLTLYLCVVPMLPIVVHLVWLGVEL
jgi:hypothetical protein